MSEILAKQEVLAAYQKAQAAGAVNNDSVEGKEFGRVCAKWHDWYLLEKPKSRGGGDRVRFMWKALGIPHTAAYHWMAIYRAESGKQPPVQTYTQEEIAHLNQKKENENRLAPLFSECGFKYEIRQNCALSTHFDVVFKALSESEVKRLAEFFIHNILDSTLVP